MGKVKGFFWFLVFAFVMWSLIMWFIGNPGDAGDAANGIGDTLIKMKDALGIFWSHLFK